MKKATEVTNESNFPKMHFMTDDFSFRPRQQQHPLASIFHHRRLSAGGGGEGGREGGEHLLCECAEEGVKWGGSV